MAPSANMNSMSPSYEQQMHQPHISMNIDGDGGGSSSSSTMKRGLLTPRKPIDRLSLRQFLQGSNNLQQQQQQQQPQPQPPHQLYSPRNSVTRRSTSSTRSHGSQRAASIIGRLCSNGYHTSNIDRSSLTSALFPRKMSTSSTCRPSFALFGSGSVMGGRGSNNNNKLFGRNQEHMDLIDAYETCQVDEHVAVVMIQGAPRTGKTVLAHSLRRVVMTDGGCFVSTQFDRSDADMYHTNNSNGWVSCLTECLDNLLETADREHVVAFARRLVQLVGPDDLYLLLEQFTGLERVLQTIQNETIVMSQTIPTSPTRSSGNSGSARHMMTKMDEATTCSPVAESSGLVHSSPCAAAAAAASSKRNQRLCSRRALFGAERNIVGNKRKSGGNNKGLLSRLLLQNEKQTISSLLMRPPSSQLLGTKARERYRQALAHFLAALSLHAPVVVVLDDFQNASVESMEILKTMATTCDVRMPCLIVAIHTVKETLAAAVAATGKTTTETVAALPASGDWKYRLRPFPAYIKDLQILSMKAASDDGLLQPPQAYGTGQGQGGRDGKDDGDHDMEHKGVRFSTIHLDDFDIVRINTILSELLRKSAHATLELSKLIFNATQGKVSDVFYYIRMFLCQEIIIKDEHMGWTWDIERVKKHFVTVEAVLEYTMQIVKERLPKEAQAVLQVASIMGDVVDDSALDLVLNKGTGPCLELAASQGILTFVPQSGGYRFSHDWTRQAAFDLIPKQEQEQFHRRVGRTLWVSSPPAAVEKNIFVIVSLLNIGYKLIRDDKERTKIAELNLKAAKRAIRLSAFSEATRFLRKGISLLGPKRWKSHYELALDLYSTAAEVDVDCGRYDRAAASIEEIEKNARSLQDKIRAFCCSIRAMQEQGNLSDAAKLGLDALQGMGEALASDPSKSSTKKEMDRVKSILRRMTAEDILSLPLMEDEEKIGCLQILNAMFRVSYVSRSEWTGLIAMKAVLLTLEYGLHSFSAEAFATYGIMHSAMGADVHLGFQFGQLALSIADQVGSPRSAPSVEFVAAAISHWVTGTKYTLPLLEGASRSAFEVGDIDICLRAKIMKCNQAFFAGTPVALVEEEMKDVVQLARKYSKRACEIACLGLLQLLQCYSGGAKDSARLNGDILKFDEAVLDLVGDKNMTWAALLDLYAMELAYRFGDYEFADRISQGGEAMKSGRRAFFGAVETPYKQGLIAIALAREGVRRRANEKLAHEVKSKLSHWANQAPGSYSHKSLLFDAELQTLNSRKGVKGVLAAYDKALKVAEGEGYTNEAALIQERAGDFLLSRKDREGAIKRWKCAIVLYEEWGVVAKSDQLIVKSVKISDTKPAEHCEQAPSPGFDL